MMIYWSHMCSWCFKRHLQRFDPGTTAFLGNPVDGSCIAVFLVLHVHRFSVQLQFRKGYRLDLLAIVCFPSKPSPVPQQQTKYGQTIQYGFSLDTLCFRISHRPSGRSSLTVPRDPSLQPRPYFITFFRPLRSYSKQLSLARFSLATKLKFPCPHRQHVDQWPTNVYPMSRKTRRTHPSLFTIILRRGHEPPSDENTPPCQDSIKQVCQSVLLFCSSSRLQFSLTYLVVWVTIINNCYASNDAWVTLDQAWVSIGESVRSFRISFTVVLERTEVDELLLKHLHVPFGLWLYRYVRVNVYDFLCSSIFHHFCPLF